MQKGRIKTQYKTKIESLVLRDAVPQDAGEIHRLILAIAEYEKMLDEVTSSVEDIFQSIFVRGEAQVILAECDGKTAGFALYFSNYSTFSGRANMYLEDIFVYPEMRGRGIGKALFTAVASKAYERGDGRMDWVCLNWNRPSIEFYKSMGAVPMSDWTVFRLDRSALEKLAKN